ncbi:MAG: hypothetical protein AB2A00_35380 [Myxococcota bacterium]
MAAADVKEKILDTLDDVRQTVVRLAKDFREETVYVKAKAGVIGGYVVIALLTLIIAPPPGEDNPIDARVKVSSISFGSREKTFVEVINESGAEWREAKVFITGSFTRGADGKDRVTGTYMLVDRWRRGEKRNLFPEKFKDEKNTSPEMDIKVETVVIEVDGEKYVKKIKKAGEGS